MRKKRISRLRHATRLLTPLTFVCGLIAIVYFFYRAVLITVPAVSFEQQLFHRPSSESIVCGSEEGTHLKDPDPVLSTQYQERVKAQKPSPNLVTNPSLTAIDPDTNGPIGYSHNAEAPTSVFELLQDSKEGVFLRITNQHPVAEPIPIWQMDPVTITSDRTYAYQFLYRSSVPVRVDTEAMKDGKSLLYRHVMMLDPSNAWKEFTAHFDNDDGATSLRFLLIGQGEGYVDSRAFTIRQIPSAKLASGVVSVTFDDGWQSVKDQALPLLNRYHIRSTEYIISEVSEKNVAGYMGLGTVSSLQQDGQEIGSHSLLHCNQTELSPDMVKDNAARSKQILEQHNLGPIKSFAYPLGQYNKATQAIFSHYYPLIRTSDFGYNDHYFDETNIHSIGITNTTSDETLKSWLAYAKSHKLWVVLVYHRVNENGEYNVTTTQLERQLKLIADSGLKVLPVSEAAAFTRK